MLRPRKASLLVLTAFAVPAAFAAEYKPGEVIVKYKEGIFRSRTAMNALYDSVNASDIQRFEGIMTGYERLVIGDKLNVKDAVAELNKNPAIEYAQPNYILRAYPMITETTPRSSLRALDGEDEDNGRYPCIIPGIPLPPGCTDDDTGGDTPSDPTAARPALKEPPQEVTPAVADPDLGKTYGMTKIQAQKAWDVHRGSKSMIVADIDTGIDYNHEDLSYNMWRNPNPSDKKDTVGFNFVFNDGLPWDDNEHGTHTGGTIAAVGGNGIAISGVIQNVSLMSLKFLSGDGGGTTSDAIRAIDYAVEHGAKVLSNSWGGHGDPDNKALKDAIDRAKSKDVLFVAAAGNESSDNDGSDPAYPASFDSDNIISVAATDEQDKLTYFSNFGKKTVHLAAPGSKIYSTIPNNKYRTASGTSMACPHVAGAAALVWSYHPKWTYKKVKEVLLSSVDELPSLKDKTVTGGRLNVFKAINKRDE